MSYNENVRTQKNKTNFEIGDLVIFAQNRSNRAWIDEDDQSVLPGSRGVVIDVNFEKSDDDVDPSIWFNHTIFLSDSKVTTRGWTVSALRSMFEVD